MTTNQPATELTKATTAALCDRGFIGFRTIAQTENTTVYHTTGSAAAKLGQSILRQEGFAAVARYRSEGGWQIKTTRWA